MKSFLINLIFASILHCVVSAFCQQDTMRFSIEKWKISGNHSFSSKEIRKNFNRAECSLNELNTMINNLLVAYQAKGYFFTTIVFNDSAAVGLIKVEEGLPLQLASINLIGADSLLRMNLLSQLDLRRKDFPSEAMANNIENLLSYLENNGYPFSKISIDSLTLLNNESENKSYLNCFLHLHSGDYVRIDSIHVAGNEITRTKVIIRETRLKYRTAYNHQQVSRIPERLMKTGYFDQAEPAEIFIDKNGRGHLLIKVKEGNPNQLAAVFGYNPATRKNERGYLTGQIDVGFTNLLGTGRVIEAYWRKKDQKSQELKFRYVEPWIRGLPINIGLGFQQTIQDTSFVRRNWGLDIDVPFSDILTIKIRGGKETVLPDSIGQLLYQLPASNSYLTTIGFLYDTRDNRWNPSRGIFYGTEFEFASKSINRLPENLSDSTVKKGRFRRDRWSVDSEIYLPTFRWQTILVGVHWRQVKSTEQALSIADLFRMGGTTTLRGYREDEFLGEKIAWLNLEYRYLLGTKSRVFLFADGGYFARRDNKNEFLEHYKFSFGFGVRIETRLGIIGVDYGLGEGRGLTSGLVHVGLMNRF